MSGQEPAASAPDSGDSQKETFNELLAPLLAAAYRLAVTMLKDPSEAEDAVQEAAMKTWRKIDRFRKESDLRPWFLAIVANECRSARRSRWWQVLRSPDLRSHHSEGSPEVRWAERIDLDAALDRLPQSQLLPLVLYYHLDLPVDDVARVLGCSVIAARQRIHRAVIALRPSMAIEITE